MVARAVFVLACGTAIFAAAKRPAGQTDALFEFHSNPWLNLHHLLWARGERAAQPEICHRDTEAQRLSPSVRRPA